MFFAWLSGAGEEASARSPVLHKSIVFDQSQSRFHLLTTPEVELLVSALKPDDAAYNLYVGMVTFQPGSGRWISELHSVELQTGR